MTGAKRCKLMTNLMQDYRMIDSGAVQGIWAAVASHQAKVSLI